MSFARTRRMIAPLAICAAAGAAVTLAGVPSTAAAAGAGAGRTMDIQILSFNDFHGNLDPPGGSSGRVITGHALTDGVVTDTTVDAGGVEYLATNLRRAREGTRTR